MTDRLRSAIQTGWIVLLCFLISSCQQHSQKKYPQKILRIGTVHRATSKNIFYDETLSLFSVISHPPLLKLKQNGRVSGLLAENFSFSPDYRSWVFRLKRNRYWSDGKPVTSADVKFTLRFKSRHQLSRRWLQKVIQQIETTGTFEIRVVFNQPYTRFDIEMTSIRIFPRHIWKDIHDPKNIEPKSSFTGCGPFVIQDIELFSGTIRFVRNQYWKGRDPWLNGYEVHMYHNPDVLALALERGDMDCTYKYADTFPYVYIPRIKTNEKLRLLRFRQSGVIFLGFNLRNSPLDNLNVRESIRQALNYQEIVKLMVGGYGEIPAKGFIPPHFLYYQPSEFLHQNNNQSKLLLDSLGYRDSNRDGIREDKTGRTLSLDLVTTPLYIRLAELVKDYIEQIGIRVRIRILDPATWIAAKDNYHYDLTITRTTPWGMMMHAGWASGYFDSRRSGEGVLHTIEDPDYVKLCDDILATKDPSQLLSHARNIQNYYAEQIPAVALIWKNDLVPVKSNLSGWIYDPLFGIYNQDCLLGLEFTHESH